MEGIPFTLSETDMQWHEHIWRGLVTQRRFEADVQAFRAYKLGGGGVTDMMYSPALYGVDLGSAAAAPRPRARSNAHMVISGDTLWLLGGTVEVGRHVAPCVCLLGSLGVGVLIRLLIPEHIS